MLPQLGRPMSRLAVPTIGDAVLRVKVTDVLLPVNPDALLRRITSLIFCLVATRSYATSASSAQSGRLALAVLLGIVLPRWPELWTYVIVSRAVLVGLERAVREMKQVMQDHDPNPRKSG